MTAAAHPKPRGRHSGRLTEDQIRHILVSGEGDTALAAQMGCTRSMIHQIKIGRAYAHVLPEIERRQPDPTRFNKSCRNCLHFKPWVNSKTGHEHCGCSFGFPEAYSTGGKFAAECVVYLEVRQ